MPDWLSLSGEFRFRGEARRGLGFAPEREDGYGLVRTRINIGIKPAGWLKFNFQGQDSRAPGIREGLPNYGGFRDPFDVRLAYVQIGGDDSTVSLSVGRLLLVYGDHRMFGAQDWSNTSREFDAIKLRIQGRDSFLDIFSASHVLENPDSRINHSSTGTNVHGFYGSLRGALPNANVDPYILWQTEPDIASAAGEMDRYTAGLRIWHDEAGPWDYDLSLNRQWGEAAGIGIDAWGYYAELGHSFDAALSPRLYAEYNFGSGDSDPGDNTAGGFINPYPSPHRWWGYNDQVGWRNLKHIRAGTQVWPSTGVRLQFDFHSFWLADKRDGLYTLHGQQIAIRPPDGGALDAKVGDEVNATVSFPVNELVSVDAGAGYLFPGPFLEANTPANGNTFAYFMVAYRF